MLAAFPLWALPITIMLDTRILGIAPSNVQTNATVTAPTGGFLVVIPITSCVCTAFTPYMLSASGTPVTAFTLAAGQQMLGVKTLTFTGTAQIFYYL